MCGCNRQYQYAYTTSTGWFGIGAVVVGTLILIALLAVFVNM
jgi:hypothetical protein